MVIYPVVSAIQRLNNRKVIRRIELVLVKIKGRIQIFIG